MSSCPRPWPSSPSLSAVLAALSGLPGLLSHVPSETTTPASECPPHCAFCQATYPRTYAGLACSCTAAGNLNVASAQPCQTLPWWSSGPSCRTWIFFLWSHCSCHSHFCFMFFPSSWLDLELLEGRRGCLTSTGTM